MATLIQKSTELKKVKTVSDFCSCVVADLERLNAMDAGQGDDIVDKYQRVKDYLENGYSIPEACAADSDITPEDKLTARLAAAVGSALGSKQSAQ